MDDLCAELSHLCSRKENKYSPNTVRSVAIPPAGAAAGTAAGTAAASAAEECLLYKATYT